MILPGAILLLCNTFILPDDSHCSFLLLLVCYHYQKLIHSFIHCVPYFYYIPVSVYYIPVTSSYIHSSVLFQYDRIYLFYTSTYLPQFYYLMLPHSNIPQRSYILRVPFTTLLNRQLVAVVVVGSLNK